MDEETKYWKHRAQQMERYIVNHHKAYELARQKLDRIKELEARNAQLEALVANRPGPRKRKAKAPSLKRTARS